MRGGPGTLTRDRLKTHAEPKLGRRRITDIRRGGIQVQIVDQMASTHSGSRVRSVVNSLRALYRWAQECNLANHDPAQTSVCRP